MTDHAATAREDTDTSQLNALTVGRYFECFAKGDYLGMQSCLHPEVQFSDIGFDLRRREVAAMWHMIIKNGIQVTVRDIKADGDTGRAHWECDYQFRKDEDAAPRPVHNSIQSTFRFESGLIREQQDDCDFWRWFEQAIGPIGKAAHLAVGLEDKLERLLKRDLPLDLEETVRKKVKDTARQKIDAFISTHPDYAH